MFIEPTITSVLSRFSGYIWLDTKIVLKKFILIFFNVTFCNVIAVFATASGWLFVLITMISENLFLWVVDVIVSAFDNFIFIYLFTHTSSLELSIFLVFYQYSFLNDFKHYYDDLFDIRRWRRLRRLEERNEQWSTSNNVCCQTTNTLTSISHIRFVVIHKTGEWSSSVFDLVSEHGCCSCVYCYKIYFSF